MNYIIIYELVVVVEDSIPYDMGHTKHFQRSTVWLTLSFIHYETIVIITVRFLHYLDVILLCQPVYFTAHCVDTWSS